MILILIYDDNDKYYLHLYLQIDGFFSPQSHARTLAGLGSSRHALIRALAGSSKDSDRSGMVVYWWLSLLWRFETPPVCAILKMNIDEHLSQKFVCLASCDGNFHQFRSTQFLWENPIYPILCWPSPGRRCETGIRESSVLFLFFK